MEIYNEGVYDLLDVGTRDKPLEEWTKVLRVCVYSCQSQRGALRLRRMCWYRQTQSAGRMCACNVMLARVACLYTYSCPTIHWHARQIMMMDDEDGEMHLRNLKLYEATTEEVSACTCLV